MGKQVLDWVLFSNMILHLVICNYRFTILLQFMSCLVPNSTWEIFYTTIMCWIRIIVRNLSCFLLYAWLLPSVFKILLVKGQGFCIVVLVLVHPDSPGWRVGICLQYENTCFDVLSAHLPRARLLWFVSTPAQN